MAKTELLCTKCAGSAKDGLTEPYPGEYVRAKWGTAKQPTQEQRTLYVNGKPSKMDAAYYNCDGCNAIIKPGERVLCQTIYIAGRDPRDGWEAGYLEG